MAQSEIRALTGLRGLAALYVAVYHGTLECAGDGLLGNFLRHGYNAVDLFFILSGFVMALTYGAQFENGVTREQFLVFLGKRIARVYPLYALMTLVTFIILALHLSRLQQVSDPLSTLALNLAGIQAWGFADSIVAPAWSISTEWGAYLIFPLLANLVFSRSTWRPLALGVAACISLLVIAIGPPDTILGQQSSRFGPLDVYGPGTIAPLVRCIAAFTLGLLAYRWRHSFGSWYSYPLAALLLVVLLFSGTDLIFVAICTALIPSLSRDTGLVARVLGSRPIFALGVWSYSIYLVHVRFNPVRVGAESLFGYFKFPAAPQLAVAVSTLAVIACSALVYRFVEKPGRDLVRSFLVVRNGPRTRSRGQRTTGTLPLPFAAVSDRRSSAGGSPTHRSK